MDAEYKPALLCSLAPCQAFFYFIMEVVNALDLAELIGVSLDIENYCTLRLFFDLSTLAGLSRRNLPEAGIRLL
ncbi:hypothetical protein OFS96_26530, partial [Escherichia coli]|nr:hypothetical protein [Escherichia coli]